MLEIRDISCQKNGIPIFEGIDIKVEPGQCLHIQGNNGSGKTSLLRIIAGLSPAETGSIMWMGENINNDRESYYSNLLYLGHQPSVKDNLTAFENLSFLLELAGINHDEHNKRAALKNAGLTNNINTSAHMLSAGQKSRLVMSRLWLDNRKLWLLDEPFNALDSIAISSLETLINNHLENNGIAIITTHQPLQIDEKKLKVLKLAI